jgi:hypothetical protein
VSNFKWGIVFGAAALVISIFIGIISGVRGTHIFFRAMFFTAAFFGVGMGLRALFSNFFTEVMYAGEDQAPAQESFDQPGSRVNITLGVAGDGAVPEMYKDMGDSLGNIEDLISGAFKPRPSADYANGNSGGAEHTQDRAGGLDRSRESDYNTQGADDGEIDFEPVQYQAFQSASAPESAPRERPAFTPSFGDDSDDLGGLPDLDSMAMAFSGGFGSDGGFGEAGFSAETAQPQPQQIEAEEPEKQYNKGNKPQPLEGDFDPKELAQGIRTVLSKDNK